MYEQWHPLGIVGIISAFNFPVAVWSWNSMLAWVCGDVSVWKGSEKTPLCSFACQQIVSKIFEMNGVPEGVSCIITGGREAGEWISADPRITTCICHRFHPYGKGACICGCLAPGQVITGAWRK
ncbi:MAG: aldehyde dehydrogenase family protein [Puia sp.]